MILGRGRGLNLQEILGPSSNKSGKGPSEKTVSQQMKAKLSPLAAAFQPRFPVSRSSSSSSLRSSISIDEVNNPYSESTQPRLVRNRHDSSTDSSAGNSVNKQMNDETTQQSPTNSPGVYHGYYTHKRHENGDLDKILITVKKSSKNFADNLIKYLESKTDQLGPAGCMAAPQFKTFYVCGSEKVTFAGSSKSGLLDRCIEVLRECYLVTTDPISSLPDSNMLSLSDPITLSLPDPIKPETAGNYYEHSGAGDSSPEIQMTQRTTACHQTGVYDCGDGGPKSDLRNKFLRTGQIEMYRSNKACRIDEVNSNKYLTSDLLNYHHQNTQPCHNYTPTENDQSDDCRQTQRDGEDWDLEAGSEPAQPFVFGRSAFKHLSVAVNLGDVDAWSHLASGKSKKQWIKERREFFFSKTCKPTLSESDRLKLRSLSDNNCRDVRLTNESVENISASYPVHDNNTACNQHDSTYGQDDDVFTHPQPETTENSEHSTSQEEEIPVINIKFDEIKINQSRFSSTSSNSSSDHKTTGIVPGAVESRAVDMSVQTNIQSINTIILPIVQPAPVKRPPSQTSSIGPPAELLAVQPAPVKRPVVQSTPVKSTAGQPALADSPAGLLAKCPAGLLAERPAVMISSTRLTYTRTQLLHYSRSHLSKNDPDFIIDESLDCIAGKNPYLPETGRTFNVDMYQHREEYTSSESMFSHFTSEMFKPRLNRLNSAPSSGNRISNFAEQFTLHSAPLITSFADLYKSNSSENLPNNLITSLPQLYNTSSISTSSNVPLNAPLSAPVEPPDEAFTWRRGQAVPEPDKPDTKLSVKVPQVADVEQSIHWQRGINVSPDNTNSTAPATWRHSVSTT